MLNIDRNTFAYNLKLTQEYCRLQTDKKQSNNAEVFRSFNPTVNDKPLFSFEVKSFNFDIQPNLRSYVSTQWLFDPTDMGNEVLIDNLFKQQIRFKECQNLLQPGNYCYGDILISQIDCTVIDGASEIESLGLIDLYDMQPIDTWFYLMQTKESRLLFAWIPKDFEDYINKAISVNFLDLIHWFKQLYPEDYDALMMKSQ